MASTILGGLIYLFIFSPVFQVKEVIISGNKRVAEGEMKSVVEVSLGKSIFLVNLDKVKKNILERFPQIANIEISRGFPGSLNILVVERLAVANFCKDNDCFLIDNEGVIFEEATEETGLIIRSGVADGVEKNQMDSVLKISSKLKDNLKIPIEEILIVSGRRINVKTLEGWEIYFNPEKDLDWQLTKLSILLKERIPPEKRRNTEYIDLRFEKIYIYPENYQQ